MCVITQIITTVCTDMRTSGMTKEEAIKSLVDKGVKLERWSLPKDGKARVVLECSCVPDTAHELDILCEGDD